MIRTFYIIAFFILIFPQINFSQFKPQRNESKTLIKVEKAKLNYGNLQIQAGKISQAGVNGEFNIVVDYTYPIIVEKLGGRERMISFLQNDFAQMKADGFELVSVEVGQAKQIEEIDGQLFAILPTTMIIKSPQGKARGESSIIGISNDTGINWKFISAINQERFKKVFPKVAEKIQIPDEKPPTLILQ